MNQQFSSSKHERQMSSTFIPKQQQQVAQQQPYGHRKNFSQQIEVSKESSFNGGQTPHIQGTPNSKDAKPMFSTAKIYDTPNSIKKTAFDVKNSKPSASISNLRSILTQSHNQALSSTAVMNATPPTIPYKSNYSLAQSSKSYQLNHSDINNINNTTMSQNQHNLTTQNIKEFESTQLQPIDEVNFNNVKKMPPLTQILQYGKIPTEIPRSTFNFSIDTASRQKSPTTSLNYSPTSTHVSQTIQKPGNDPMSIAQTASRTQPPTPQSQQPPQLNQQSVNYFQKSSYTHQQHTNQTPSTTLQNTQSISNSQNKTNPILHNYQQHQQQTKQEQGQQQFEQQFTQYQQQVQQQHISKQPSIYESNLGQLAGATLTESQNTQKAQNTNQNTMVNHSGVSSITNISNFNQQDNPSQSALKSEGLIQAAKAMNLPQRDYLGQPVKKEERSNSRDQGMKKESPTRIASRKESTLQSQNSSRSNSQGNQNKYRKSTMNINLGVVNQSSSSAQKAANQANIQELRSSSNSQNYEEPRKQSAIPAHLGIKNTNINLMSLTNSQLMNSSVSNQQSSLNQQPSNQTNNSINIQNFKSQFRKESLIGFQIPQFQMINNNIKQFSKQASSQLLVDCEEGSINSTIRNNQRSQTQLNQSPGRDRSPMQLIKASSSQKSIQDLCSSPTSKMYGKRNFDQSSPMRSAQEKSPTKSLFQMIKLSSQQGGESSPMMNTSQKMAKKRRFQSILNLTSSDSSGNVKTFLRFRPNNTMELDLNNQGLGQNIINYIDDFSISIVGEQQMVYTVDQIFRSDDPQEKIYDSVGKEVIEDVFQGYNGTIFTYGVTGSGKTYTMFGNISDEFKKGIIPRISNQIFHLLENDEDGTEFIINCSMLEIYKEILYDSFQEGKHELKIKENVQKGIYVQGLTQTSIASEDELIQLIDIGYNTKRTRETRLNEYSSRSHTIFMIEIQQRLSNGDEKVGKINLVDLAGAEKVSRSGAQGESLEEAIKINLSLSCLGKVIHSLTNGNDYIPYRDSKLTRILQESLGGNYKTSLIVTCSMHSSFQDDTISSLKFATRAKTIKNTFKMNIKVNPINLQKELENLKMQTESYKYMLQNVKTIFSDAHNKMSSLPNIQQDPKLYEIKNKLDEFLTLQSMIEDLSGISNQDLPQTAMGSSSGSGSANGPIDNRYITNFLSTKKDAILVVKDENIKQLQQVNSDQSEQIQSLQSENQELKKENMNLTAKVNELSQERNRIKLQLNKQLSKNEFSTFSLEIMQKQIQHLVDSVCGAEKKISSTLQEKKNVIEMKFQDYLKEKLTFSEVKLADYFKNSINFNFESPVKGYKDVQQNLKKFNLDGDDDFMAEKSMDMESSSLLDCENFNEPANNTFSNNVETLDIMNQNKLPIGFPYAKKPRMSSSNPTNSQNSFAQNIDSKLFQNENIEILKQIFAMPSKLDMASVTETLSNDFIIVFLKKQLIDSHILNQNLLRTVNALEWKQIIEYGKSNLKQDQIHFQKKQIKLLEKVLDEVTENHKELRLKIEDLEFDIYQQAQTKPIESAPTDVKKSNKNKIIIPLTPQNAQRSQLLKGDNKKSAFSDPKSQNFSKNSLSNIPTFQKDLFEIQQSFIDLELDIIPLTYENALEELKKRNTILKRLGELDLLNLESFEAYAPQKETDEFIKNERERLNNKIVILQQELKMEQVKVDSFKHSLLVERKTMKNLKKLTEDMEVSLRNNLKEENESWQQTINELTEQNKIELTRRQQEYNQLKEILFSVVEISLTKVQELKGRWQSQELTELENIIIEMEKAKLSIGKSYENSIKKRQRNSSVHSMAILTPKRAFQSLELSQQKSQQLQQS